MMPGIRFTVCREHHIQGRYRRHEKYLILILPPFHPVLISFICTSPKSAVIFRLLPGFWGPHPLLLPHRSSFGRRGPRPHCSCRECTLQPSPSPPPPPLEVCFCTRSRSICCRFFVPLQLFMDQIPAVQNT